ncbi:glyoxalase [Amycolatopsis acidicola]|uniref:Glyoxalase n=1 Tax=Amycolatopsis acidicola TaxID=2596893 RepID=A0A5N0V995_9PSEU|nr:VOC family protein [Amycolatopsis acidicola]KAA9162966.1 glyoxalase [Amycolatopsis acidicola]
MTRISQIRTIGIPVRDQDRAVEFYVGTLGFEKRMDVSYGQRWVEVAPAGSTTTIALVRSDSPGVDTGIRLTTADAAADHAGLREHGVDVDAEILRWQGVPPMFSLRDPDGNRLLLVEATNRT